ncbi:hypothetical protein [Chlorogloea sp. CCALA 695]|nr:hypothetical protein [Chlorogloea sp. CCALA 695]PSB35127.1 hypothetical protein C7B70_02415 [Chlorogloea sp. CCALA 695]
MKHIPSIIIGLSTLFLTPTAYASSCSKSDLSFVQLAKRSQLAIRGKVIKYHWSKNDQEQKGRPRAMIVEVKEVYKGVTKLAKVTVWGDNGMQTRPYVTQFPIGTEWVLALSKDYWTQKGELAISGCGEYWLQVKGNNVVGKVTDGRIKAKPQVVSLPNLRKLLKAAP